MTSYPIVRSVVIATILLITAGFFRSSPVMAKATVVHDNYSVPVDEIIYSDCAGKEIQFVGEFYLVQLHRAGRGGQHAGDRHRPPADR